MLGAACAAISDERHFFFNAQCAGVGRRTHQPRRFAPLHEPTHGGL